MFGFGPALIACRMSHAQQVQARPLPAVRADQGFGPSGYPSADGEAMISPAIEPFSWRALDKLAGRRTHYTTCEGPGVCRSLRSFTLGFMKKIYASLRGLTGLRIYCRHAPHNALRAGFVQLIASLSLPPPHHPFLSPSDVTDLRRIALAPRNTFIVARNTAQKAILGRKIAVLGGTKLRLAKGLYMVSDIV